MSYERSWIEVRTDRLRADFERLRELTRNSELIAIEELEGDPPESYVVRFSCRGILAAGTGEPIIGDRHLVRISFPVEYPTRPPQMRWLTEIFHPNINREGTHVCIDAWYPSKFLDELCVMLGRMIQYKNYNPYNCLRVDAALWSKNSPHLLPVDDRPLRRGEPVRSEPQVFEIRLL